MNANIGTQILLEGAQELLGTDSFHQAVAGLPSHRLAGPGVVLPEEVGAFFQSLEQIYGCPAGRGIAMRIGRASFRYGLNHVGDILGLRTMEFRLLPAPRRLELGLDILAAAIMRICGCQVGVEDAGNAWLWRMDGGPFDAGQQGSQPLCLVVAGLLQEFMAWAGGGRFYRVSGLDAAPVNGCVFRLEKKPLD